jgi:methionyl-tRNA formyltransferase
VAYPARVSVRLAFLGNDPWSVAALDLIAGEPELDPVVVITNPAKPAGRGGRATRTAVAGAATRIGVPLVEAEGVRSGPGFEALLSAAADVLVVVAYGHLLTRETLELCPFGGINLHFSLLPRWRGAAPVQHALLAGDTTTGVTVMRMDEGLDTGPILNQLEEEIRPEDDAGSLGARLAHIGAILLTGVLRMLPTGGVPARPQDDRLATVAPRLGPDDRVLRWSEPAEQVVRRVRALAPEPGASTTFRGEPLKILTAAVDRDHPGAEPAGALVSADDRGVLVASGSGGVRLVEVAPAGRRRMPAAAWARGARFGADERLG